jgi:hypothetical protein
MINDAATRFSTPLMSDDLQDTGLSGSQRSDSAPSLSSVSSRAPSLSSVSSRAPSLSPLINSLDLSAFFRNTGATEHDDTPRSGIMRQFARLLNTKFSNDPYATASAIEAAGKVGTEAYNNLFNYYREHFSGDDNKMVSALQQLKPKDLTDDASSEGSSLADKSELNTPIGRALESLHGGTDLRRIAKLVGVNWQGRMNNKKKKEDVIRRIVKAAKGSESHLMAQIRLLPKKKVRK